MRAGLLLIILLFYFQAACTYKPASLQDLPQDKSWKFNKKSSDFIQNLVITLVLPFFRQPENLVTSTPMAHIDFAYHASHKAVQYDYNLPKRF